MAVYQFPEPFATNQAFTVGAFNPVSYSNTEEYINEVFNSIILAIEADTSTTLENVKTAIKGYIEEARQNTINYLRGQGDGIESWIITGLQVGYIMAETGLALTSSYINFHIMKKAGFTEWLSTVQANSSTTTSWDASGVPWTALGMTAQTAYTLKKEGTDGGWIKSSNGGSTFSYSAATDQGGQQGISKGQTLKVRDQYSGSRKYYYVGLYSSQINTTGAIIPLNPDGKEDSVSGKYPSTELGGTGTYDDSTALSDISTVPALNIANLGFFSLWRPTTGQLVQLADFVWNDPTNFREWPEIFQSGILKPLDYIINLQLLPIPSTAISTTLSTFSMGGIVFDGRLAALGKTISMEKVNQQIVDVDLGSISLKEYFGSFLDHAPYTTVNIYLPYYGFTELSTNEIMNADSIHIVYRVNLLDGTTAIKVHIERGAEASAVNGSIPLKHTLYEYYTNISTNIPLTQSNNTENMKKIATICAAAASVVAAPIAGAGVAAVAGGIEGATVLGGVGGALTGASLGAEASAGAAAASKIASGAVKAGAGMANKAINSMPSGGGVQRGNQGSFSQGLLSERRPYLIVHRPIQVLPEGFKEFNGYAASITRKLGDLSGLVKVDSIKLTNINATEEERAEILSLLTGGVYL